ncbi:hypothetical protein BH23VER1_BH23VER1_05540 [soil metagenome]
MNDPTRLLLLACAVALGLCGAPSASANRVTTVIGQAKNSPLDTPFGVALLPGEEGKEDLVILEYDGGRLFKLDRAGELHLVAGEHRTKGYVGDGGPAPDSRFDGLHSLAIAPDGTIYLADTWNHAIRTISPDGKVGTLAGNGEAGFSGDGGNLESAQFDSPISIELSPDAATLYVVDLKNRRLRAIDIEAGSIRTVAGSGDRGIPTDGKEATSSPLVDPRAVAVGADGTLYLLERGGHALRKVSPDGKISTVAGTGEKGNADGPARDATFDGPKDVAVAGDGTVYIADAENHLIRKYDPEDGTISTILGGEDSPTKLARPHGVYISPDGDLFVTDSYNHRVLKLKVEEDENDKP